MTTTFEALDSADEPRPSRLFIAPRAGSLACADAIPTDWLDEATTVSPEWQARDAWEEPSRQIPGESRGPLLLGAVLEGLALFDELDRPDMTDTAIANPAAASSAAGLVEAMVARIDAVLDEEAWLRNPGVASMTPSQAPRNETWRL